MKPILTDPTETPLEQQLRETLASMARATSLPADAWTRFEQAVEEFTAKAQTTAIPDVPVEATGYRFDLGR